MKVYIVGTHKKHLSEVLLMISTTCFCGEIRKMSISGAKCILDYIFLPLNYPKYHKVRLVYFELLS